MTISCKGAPYTSSRDRSGKHSCRPLRRTDRRSAPDTVCGRVAVSVPEARLASRSTGWSTPDAAMGNARLRLFHRPEEPQQAVPATPALGLEVSAQDPHHDG